MHKLIEIEGIGEQYAALLQTAGIENQTQLLDVCGHRNGRQTIAEKTGISPKLILKWTNQADLARIKGISEEYSELLERSGVDSVLELAQRRPDNLHQALQATNEHNRLVRQLPSLSQVESWIIQAKKLPRAVYH
ncbi:putative RecB family nuclease, TM0106 family [Legionella donaldsonii]|uniref:Putative RecB family nuclease, TM0106 family n=1 Tax=Legionella donaldsonii TaxID=45060 RepID=A0A378IZ62_9GAMM|nr:DUF4332 domain-containing protein [Legionella donaldsonii]STX40645.1 putative RecB family nuclease, TM0106 family [Legionella donaldsonii]